MVVSGTSFSLFLHRLLLSDSSCNEGHGFFKAEIETQQLMVQKILDPMPEMVAIIGPMTYTSNIIFTSCIRSRSLRIHLFRRHGSEDAINSGSRRDGRIGRGSNSLFFLFDLYE